MALINYKECPLTINGNRIIATSSSLSLRNPKNAVFSLGKKFPVSKEKVSPIQGSLNFTFLLSDGIFIKDLVSKSTKTHTAISGNLGGILFQNGRLNSLSFNIDPPSIIWGEATISFWGKPTGELVGSTQSYQLENIGTAVGSSVSCNVGGSAIQNISSFSYSIDIAYRDQFIFGSLIPLTSIETITESVSVEAENFGEILDECGDEANVTAEIKDGCGVTFGSFSLTGDVDAQELSVNDGEFVTGGLSVTQVY